MKPSIQRPAGLAMHMLQEVPPVRPTLLEQLTKSRDERVAHIMTTVQQACVNLELLIGQMDKPSEILRLVRLIQVLDDEINRVQMVALKRADEVTR